MRPTGSTDAPTIAHVVLSLEVGGAEVLVTRMVRSLRDAGVPVHVACLDTEGPLAATVRGDGIPVTGLGRRPGIVDAACIARLRRLLLAHTATVVHTHDLEAFVHGGLGAWFAGRIPVVHTQHGLPAPFGWKQRCKVLPLRPLGRRFIGVSDEVTAVGLASRWFAPDRTTTITNGIDVATFRPDPPARQRIRRTLGIPEGDLVVICVARLATVKDHLTLVRGFAASPAASTSHLILVGDGPERPGIEAEIGRLGMTERIRLLGARADVRDLLAAADVFALTSRSEGISISLLEGMATGLVPLVTAVGGNTQLVTTGTPSASGMLIAPGAAAEFGRSLGHLATDGALRGRLGQAARATVRERFSQDAMMARYRQVYHALARGSGPPTGQLGADAARPG